MEDGEFDMLAEPEMKAEAATRAEYFCLCRLSGTSGVSGTIEQLEQAEMLE